MVAHLNPLPMYGIGDTLTSSLMVLHFFNCVFITVGSYLVITLVYFLTKRRMSEFESQLTEQTKRVQRQVERIIFIQVSKLVKSGQKDSFVSIGQECHPTEQSWS